MEVDPYAGHWETRYSAKGFSCQVWCRDMPWISPELTECAVYLYPSEAAAEDGSEMGGSGFVMSYDIHAGKHRWSQLFIVTNRHVIDSGAQVVRFNTNAGKHVSIALDEHHWITHPDGDDVAICPINPFEPIKLRSVSHRMLMTKKMLADKDISPGDDIFVMGRFVNHAGKERNLPTLRFGNIAQMPYEPISIEGREQEAFLVECRSISGFSGSPVFVYCQPQIPMDLNPEIIKMMKEGTFKQLTISRKRLHKIPFIDGPWVLGVNFCYLQTRHEFVYSKLTGRPVDENWYVRGNTGIMGVVPSWKILDILEGPIVQKIVEPFRKVIEEEAKKDKENKASKEDGAVLTSSTDQSPTNTAAHGTKEAFNALLNAAVQKQKSDE